MRKLARAIAHRLQADELNPNESPPFLSHFFVSSNKVAVRVETMQSIGNMHKPVWKIGGFSILGKL